MVDFRTALDGTLPALSLDSEQAIEFNRLASVEVSVLNYGKNVGEGGDDTDAFMSAYQDLAAGVTLRIPQKTYYISQPIPFPPAKFWHVATHGRPKIVQVTDNVPVFTTPDIGSGGDTPSWFDSGDMDIEHLNLQPASNTNGVGIKVGSDGFYQASFGRLLFKNCFRGIDCSTGLVWGNQFKELFLDASCTGSLIYCLGSAGNPANHVLKVYARGHNLTEPLININTGRYRFDVIETNEHYLGAPIMRTLSSYVDAGLVVFEEGTFSTDQYLVEIGASSAKFGVVEVQNFTVSATGGNASASVFYDNGGSGSTLQCGPVNCTGTTITAGTPTLIRAGGGLSGGAYVFADWKFDNDGWRVTDSNNTGGRLRSRVLSWELDDQQLNPSGTIQLDGTSPCVYRFTTPLSADVNIVMTGKRLMGTKEIIVIRDSGATGAFSVNVKNSDGVSVLASLGLADAGLSTGRARFRFGSQATNGWYRSA